MTRSITILFTGFIVISLSWGAPYRDRPLTSQMIPSGIDADSSHGWDALHYEVDLVFNPVWPGNLTISGSTTIRFTPTAPGPLDTMDIHFHGLWLSDVILEGVECNSFRLPNDILRVVFTQPQYPGDTLDLELYYEGTPEVTPNNWGGVGIFYSSPSMIYTQADPFGARNWMPCWDEPWDKATIRQKLTFPSQFVVVANGALEDSSSQGGYTQWVYYMNHPLTTYLISFCASNYVTFTQSAGSVAIKNYVYPGHLNAAQYDLGRVPEMITAFSNYFGPYPFDTFGYAEAPVFGGSGAMENQTMVTLGNLLINGNRTYEDIYAHELSHQWFGDAVSYLDWPDMWLSEGFATYAEALWHEHLSGMTGYFQTMNQIKNSYFGWQNQTNMVPIYDPPWNILWTPLTYEKPGSVIHTLRYQVGDDSLFFTILRNYQSLYRDGNAATWDLAEVVQNVTGDDYDWFFNQWIYQPGYPSFEYFATLQPQGGNTLVQLSVAQVQQAPQPYFRTDADLYVYDGGIPEIHRITIEALESQTIELTAFGNSDSVRLDPVGWILAAKTRRDDINGPQLAVENALIDDEGGDGFLDPGESGDLLFLVRDTGYPIDAARVTLSCTDPGLQVLEAVAYSPALLFNQIYYFGPDNFEIANNPGTLPRWVDFTAQIDDSASGNPVAALTFSLPVGTPNILLVDDDGGGSAQIKLQDALNAIRRVYRTVTYTTPGQLPPMENYTCVLWSCGDQTVNTVAPSDQALLTDYLQNHGGSLFLSGRGIVPDIGSSDFFRNVLHARAAGTTAMIILDGASMVNGLSFTISGDGLNQDVIEPDVPSGANQLLAYRTTPASGAAVVYESDYKTCVFGFGFEDVRGDNPNFSSPEELLAPIMDWMMGVWGVEPEELSQLPQNFKLCQNYPNPFNAETVIPLELPQRSHVKIEIFNVRGQNLGVIFEGVQNAGWPKIHYNAAQLSSGMYFCRVTAEGLEQEGKFNAVSKLVVLK
ncbi:MAG: M1 family aminopeptidase [bacterium]|nr:M1 family aminopeptidase [bacterium]